MCFFVSEESTVDTTRLAAYIRAAYRSADAAIHYSPSSRNCTYLSICITAAGEIYERSCTCRNFSVNEALVDIYVCIRGDGNLRQFGDSVMNYFAEMVNVNA